MRVYVPVTFIGLNRAAASGVLPSSGWRAHLLPDQAPDGGEEEHDALHAAAAASLEALRSEPEAPRRRAVVVASIPEEWADPEPDGTAILNRRIPVERFVAVYADSEAAVGDVVRALTGKDLAIDSAELEWYARQELADLVS